MILLRRDLPAILMFCLATLCVVAAPHGHAESPAAPTRIAVLADGDAQGELRACHCPGVESSGPALRAGVFRRARTFTHPVILLESGDFAAAEEDSLREERFDLFVETMSLMTYDAVGLGEGELGLEASLLKRAAQKLPLVCSNLAAESWGIPPVRVIERGGFRVLIAAYVDPSIVAKPDQVLDPLQSLSRVIPPTPDSTLVVLIAHGPDATLESIVKQFVAVDVVVRGHDLQDGPVLATAAGRVPVLLPGGKGQNVVQLTADFAKDGTLIDRTARSWELKQETRGHGRIDTLVRDFEARFGLE